MASRAQIGNPPYPSLARALWDEFTLAAREGFSNLGTYNSASRLPSGAPSDHAVYPAWAFDAGFTPATGWENTRARHFFNEMVGRPGVHYVILGDKIWSQERGLHAYTDGGHDGHVHVSGVHGSPAGPPPAEHTLSQLWIDAGGKPAKARIMAAIAMAESSGVIDAIGGPNDDGSYDYGYWQINSSHGYSKRRLLSDGRYNAHAAVDIERTQGMDAWTTYRNGAYRGFVGNRNPALPAGPPRSRPGGGPADPEQAARDNAMIAWQDWVNPDIVPGDPFPLDDLMFWKQASKAVHGTQSFFHWIAWMFHPRNILRIVEFAAGAGLFAMGLSTAVKVFSESEGSGKSGAGLDRLPIVGTAIGSAAGGAIGASRAGQAVKVRQAKRGGRQAARHEARRARQSDARKTGRSAERTRMAQRKNKRAKEDDIPF